jgi:hypothetical protein
MNIFVLGASAATPDDKMLVITFWAAIIGTSVGLVTLAAQLIGRIESSEMRSLWWSGLLQTVPYLAVFVSTVALWLGLFVTCAILSGVAYVSTLWRFARRNQTSPPTRGEVYHLVLITFLVLLNFVSIPMVRISGALM